MIDTFRLSRCHTAITRVDYRVLQLFQSRCGGMLTLTSGILRSDWTESFMMPTDGVKFPVHSLCLLRNKFGTWLAIVIIYMPFGWMSWVWMGGGEAIHTCDQSAHDPPMCVCVCACVCACMQACMRVCARARVCR